MSGKVTIATVAHHAQVSRQTVSNVLNSPHLVREETRGRVLAAIETLGYRANQAARQMRTGRSRLIAVRIEPANDGINGSILDRFLHGLTEAAAPAGYRIMLYTATGDDNEIATYDDLLASYDLDAFVLTSTHHGDARTTWLAEHDIPFVTFGRPWGAPDRHPWVDVDGAAGTAEATERLIAAGHRRIGFIGWPTGSGVGDNRREGWYAAMRAADLDPSGLERRVDDGVAEGRRSAQDLLAGAGPTALVCASDSLALGALRADARAPVAVIGFDDTPVAQAISLTSVGQPLAESAASCVELLARLLDGDTHSGRPQHVLLRPHVVVRDSG
ncbi:LacI family DNA-binding transcriptional regulator [Rugosimonospora acidiphila]|uniref:LacI family DNA-binding transcriptional regulator n=1 Tax=Rugosimonospora acidiphila TaxID=556531 RepID=A0ABP9SPV1_9ACTN